MDGRPDINALGKIASKQQLVERGLSGFDLTTAVRKGEIRRIRRAHYATPGAAPDGVLAVRVGGRLAGPTAARSYGLWGGFDDRLHVVLSKNASRLRTNYAPSVSDTLSPDSSSRELVLHWASRPLGHAECWRVSPAETLREMVEWSDRETAIACLDTARSILQFTDSSLRETLSSLATADRLIGVRSQPGSDAGTESVVRQRLLRVGVEVDQQVTITSVGRVDMVVRGTRIVIEVDGKSFHAKEDAFENDRRRDAILAALGYVVIRLSFAQVFGNWDWCERAILTALTQFRNV
jgi:very-short-patch-repair endonuclease